PVARASRRAAGAGSPGTTTSTSTTGRPRRTSRTHPPTKWASPAPIRGRRSSSTAEDMLHPPWPRRERRHDLVVDRPGHVSPLLGEDPLLAVRSAQRPHRAPLALGE